MVTPSPVHSLCDSAVIQEHTTPSYNDVYEDRPHRCLEQGSNSTAVNKDQVIMTKAMVKTYPCDNRDKFIDSKKFMLS